MVGRDNPRCLSRKRWSVFAAAVGGAVLFASPAPAFYWLGWPGSGVQPPPSIVSETVKVEHRDPKPPPVTEPPGGGPGDPPPAGPEEVPEPATLLLAGAGLATAAGARWARRRRNPNSGGAA
jgi:hypothetical protein